MKAIDASTPVVVFPALGYCSLGVIRSLGRLGVRVYVIDESGKAYGLRSRYCAGRFLFDCEGPAQEELVAFLNSIAPQVGPRPILVPTTFGRAEHFMEENAAALAQSFTFPRQPEGLIKRLYDKRSMYHLCKELGIPTAETLFPNSVDDVERFLDQVTFPVVLKPAEVHRLAPGAGVRMVFARNRDELLAEFRRLETPGSPNLMLQEYIPGSDDTIWMFNGYFDAGSECRFGLTGRKLRQHPVHTGMTSLGICLPNEAVDGHTRRLAKATGYRGIMDIGYRYDARDGLYKLLDVNPRIGASFRLFVDRNGLDVVRALYLDLTGQAVPATEPDWGRKWFVEDKDAISSWRYFKEHALRPMDWLRSYRGVQEAAYSAADDLGPTAAFAAAAGRRIAGGALRYVTRRLGRSPSRVGSRP